MPSDFIPLDPSDPPHMKLASAIVRLGYTRARVAQLLGTTPEETTKILAGEVIPVGDVRLRACNMANMVGIELLPLDWLAVKREILEDLADFASTKRKGKGKKQGQR